jgi:pyruvate,water dikinase
VWERYCVPRIEDAFQKVRAAGDTIPLAETADLYGYGVRLTHVAGSSALFARIIKDFLAAAEEAALNGEQLFGELTAGYANSTSDSNGALWELAEIADRSPSVRSALTDTDSGAAWDAIRTLPDGGEFVAAFGAYLEKYGCRSSIWGLAYPTWQEDPSQPLSLVRKILEERPPSPEELLVEGAKRREAAWREVEEQLSGQDEKLEELRRLAEPLVHYIPIREARAYWQLVFSGATRSQVLRRAQPLVERGLLPEIEDVFYITVDELERALAGDNTPLLPLTKQRRDEWTFWSQRRPPNSIGSDAAGDSACDGGRSDGLAQVIRGVGASRGTVTAPARVIDDIAHATRLQPGEVLVCAMSSPPWTPLFAIAAGVVTDSGGMLSHPAIVAREYGIPCVVGTRTGTQLIRNGDMITVDGEKGEVRMEGGGR